MMDWKGYFEDEAAAFNTLPIVGDNIEQLYQAFKARLIDELRVELKRTGISAPALEYYNGELKDKA